MSERAPDKDACARSPRRRKDRGGRMQSGERPPRGCAKPAICKVPGPDRQRGGEGGWLKTRNREKRPLLHQKVGSVNVSPEQELIRDWTCVKDGF